MFKAIQHLTGEEIIILDSHWVDSVSVLRVQGEEGLLVCQECRQPVRVRAGDKKRWHFAHKHKADCPYEGESAALLQTRALLYARLQTEFGSQVTLEKRVEGAALPRPIDCWVEREKGSFAFWIVDTNLRRSARQNVLESLADLGVIVRWILVAQLLQTSEDSEREVHLTPSQRDFLQTSTFEPLYRGGASLGASLHFLNAQTQTLTTFRGLRLLHKPQVFSGHRLETPIFEAGIAYQTGEFVHPGEREKWGAYRHHQQQLRKQEKARRQEQEDQEQQNREQQEERRQEEAMRTTEGVHPQTPPSYLALAPSRSVNWERVCIFCGELTTNWCFKGDLPKTCKCNECLKRGLY